MQCLHDLLLQQLQCTGCFNYMEPPIRLCTKGHNACDSCAQKYTTCIICQYPFMMTRNQALEELSYEVDFKCKNCDFVSNSSQMTQHQKYCDGKNLIHRCKKIIMEEDYMTKICNWSGCVEEIFKHFEEYHKKSLYVVLFDKKNIFQWKLPYQQNQRDINVVQCNGENFLQLVDYDYISQNLHFTVINIGKNKNRFHFEIHINTGSDKLKFERKVEENYATINEIHQNECYIQIPLASFKLFKVKERIICWEMDIYEDCY